ncbi:S1 family peptidase [Kytococcus sedentarius]|uniref:S1 family peptidase n=1 Tax=Kytococcus sedentarius TaxID=1276 RepID=UPI0035BC6154
MKRTSMMTALAGAAALSMGTGLAAGAAPAGSAGEAPATQNEALIGYVTQSQDMSWDEAKQYLDVKAEKTAALDELDAQGKAIDGAYFDGAELTIITDDAATAKAAEAQGITVKKGAGQAELTKVAEDAATLMEADGAIQSVGPDLKSGTVKVRVGADAKQATLDKLAAMDDVQVVKGAEQGLTTHADVIPGQIMDLEPGTNCSLGFPGTQGGNSVLLTAGHCVEGMPDVLDANGNHLGKGVESEFATGQPSVDMGLMDIAEGNTGQPFVDTRGHSGNIDVTGASKAPVGTEICKAGNTTGWTCGEIQGYDQTVDYGGTVTSGLAEASVCTEGGDSGGAYISGTIAQGMTSGGPIGVDCGWNQGEAAGSYSFYQPVVDAAEHYGVTITTK